MDGDGNRDVSGVGDGDEMEMARAGLGNDRNGDGVGSSNGVFAPELAQRTRRRPSSRTEFNPTGKIRFLSHSICL